MNAWGEKGESGKRKRQYSRLSPAPTDRIRTDAAAEGASHLHMVFPRQKKAGIKVGPKKTEARSKTPSEMHTLISYHAF